MPPVRAQTIASNGFTITSALGTFDVTISTTGNQTTLTVRQDGNIITQPTINNATPGVLETLINNAINGAILGAGSVQQFFTAVHIFVVNPVSLNIHSSDTAIGGEQWWVSI